MVGFELDFRHYMHIPKTNTMIAVTYDAKNI